MTRSRSIFGMFGQSPIRPLQMHMAKAHACANGLLRFFDAVFVNDWTQAKKMQEEIVQLENEADALKQELRLHLPKGLFMPVHRSDVLELVSAQDGIANKAKDIAGLILGRHLEFPESIKLSIKSYLERSISASAQASKAIHELDELLETGFRGHEVNIVEEMIVMLNDIEHQTDEIQIQVRLEIFSIEKNLQPVDTIFLYKIVDWIGDLSDRAQRVGGRLQLLLAR